MGKTPSERDKKIYQTYNELISMKKILMWIKNLSLNKRGIAVKNVLGGYTELSDVVSSSFIHSKLMQDIGRDVIVMIVSNNFFAEPATMLSFFNRNYNFTVDEFVILSYKIGMTSNFYVSNPSLLLEDAIKLKDVFDETTIKNLENLLEEQRIHDDNVFKQKYDEFSIKLEDDKKQAKLGAKDIENAKADALIDEWLNKDKKN